MTAARLRRMPSGDAFTFDASYPILINDDVVFVEPTGPTMKLANFVLVKNGTTEIGGV
jgi:hypothetical protein